MMQGRVGAEGGTGALAHDLLRQEQRHHCSWEEKGRSQEACFSQPRQVTCVALIMEHWLRHPTLAQKE